MKYLIILSVALLCSSIAEANYPPGPLEVFDWVAYPETGNTETINPAGLSFLSSLRLRVGLAAFDSTSIDPDRLSIAFPGMGIAGWWNDDISMRKFTLSSSFSCFGNIASVGAGYTWYDPTVNNNLYSGKHFYTLGLIIRPLEWFSVGLVRRGGIDLPDSDDIEVSHKFGLAVRPFGDNFTFVSDLEVPEEYDDSRLTAGVEVNPLNGLTVRAGAGEDHLSFGLEAAFGTARLSCGVQSDDEFSHYSSRGQITFTSSPGHDLTTPQGIFVRMEAGEFDELRQRPFLGSVQPCFAETAMLLDRIAEDNSVAGVIVDIEGSNCSPAQVEELRSLLQRIKSNGRKIYFYIEGGSGDEFYLASCGSRIWIHPCGSISFTGVSSQAFFLREFLDRIGIYPDLQHIGEYKSASDMLTRSDMSDAQRRATTALLGSIQDELIAGVANGRGLEPAQMHTIMNAGPYSAERAVTAGMVDGICYRDQIEEEVEDELGREITSVSIEEYATSIPVEDTWGPQEHIAVVIASGAIMRGESGSSFPFGRAMGSETVCDALRLASSHPGVKAIVLRIDSPGGDALASADLHHAVDRARRNVPVIVSMGGVAASGGYYMACGAERIFADRMTITGSIGIISGKFSFGGLLDSLGVNVEEVATSPMASMNSPFRKYTERERGRAFDLMEDGYNLFVETVAAGRGMTFEQVDSIGRGRVWTGTDAEEIGLVDECGGVVDAVYYAAEIAGMDTERIPEVRVYPTPSFPGVIEMPGLGVSEDVMNFLLSEQLLYLMQPIKIE